MGFFNRIFGGDEKDGESTPSSADDTQQTPREYQSVAAGTPPPNGEERDTDDGEGSETITIPDREPPTETEPPTVTDTPTSKLLLSKSPRLAGGVRVATPRPEDQVVSREPLPRASQPPAKPMRSMRGTTERSSPPPLARRRERTPGPPPLPPPPTEDTETTPAPAPKAAPKAAPALEAARPSARRAKARAAREAKVGSISGAFDAIQMADDETTDPDATPIVSSDADREAVQGVFDELAANHVDQVRSVMLELQVGDVACSWIESTRAALSSLRAMAEQMDLTDLCTALDAFTSAIDEAVASGQAKVTGKQKEELQRRYERLIELIPTAFALDGERDSREPIIVESLLLQVPGVEKLAIDKLFAAGLSRLNALMMSNAGDLAAVSGIDDDVAARIAERFATYKHSVPTAVAAQDASQERESLRALLDELKRYHAEYEKAAAGWSEDDRERKRAARKERERVFLQARVVLARLGEAERLKQIEKRPYQRRIDDIDQYLKDNARLRRPLGGAR